MATVSNLVLDLIEGGGERPTAASVGAAFFSSLEAFGVNAINARAYVAPTDIRLSEQVFYRAAPPCFMPIYSDDRFYTANPLPLEARRIVGPKRWSEVKWDGSGQIWFRETMRDCGCPDGLIIPCHGPNDYLGLVSLAFEGLDEVAPAERAAIELAGLVVHNRMRDLTAPMRLARSALTLRERDSLMFVADGRSDDEIAGLMRVTRATVVFHLNNARRKLGAKNRPQAVAAFLRAKLGFDT